MFESTQIQKPAGNKPIDQSIKMINRHFRNNLFHSNLVKLGKATRSYFYHTCNQPIDNQKQTN